MSNAEGPQVYGHAGMEVVQPGMEPVPSKDSRDYYYSPKPQLETPGKASNSIKICGLSKKTFLVAISVAFVFLVGAAVGGGIGAAMYGESHPSSASDLSKPSPIPSSSTSSSTRTSPSSTSTVEPSPFPETGILPLDCPAIDQTTYNTTSQYGNTTYTFTVHCFTNYVAFSHIGLFNTTIFEACMDKCADYNLVLGGCAAAEFQANLTNAEHPSQGQGGNCILGGQTDVPTQGDTLVGGLVTNVVNE